MELKNYDENTKAAIIAQQMQQSAAASGGKFSAEKPFPPGGEYDQQSMGVIPVSHTVMILLYVFLLLRIIIIFWSGQCGLKLSLWRRLTNDYRRPLINGRSRDQDAHKRLQK